MKSFSKCIVALALGVLLVTSVQAETFSDSATATLINDTDITLYLDKMDLPPSYVLDNVYVEMEVRLTDAQVQLDNDEVVAQDGTARVLNTANSLTSTVPLLKNDLDTINNGDMAINANQVFNLAATTGDSTTQFDATLDVDYANWEPGTLTAGDSGNIWNGARSSYIGSGQFSITINSTFLTSATFEGSCGYFEGNTPCGEVYAQVIYDYHAVPEPSVLTGLIAGLFGLLALAWRRRN